MAKPRPFIINGADSAATYKQLLTAAKRDGDEIVISRNRETHALAFTNYVGDVRPVEIQNADLQTWSTLVATFREHAGLNPPSGQATCQCGVIRAKAKKHEKKGAPLFRISIGRSTGRESPTKITVRPVRGF